MTTWLLKDIIGFTLDECIASSRADAIEIFRYRGWSNPNIVEKKAS